MAYACSELIQHHRNQVRTVAVKFLKDNPADRHLPGVTLSCALSTRRLIAKRTNRPAYHRMSKQPRASYCLRHGLPS